MTWERRLSYLGWTELGSGQGGCVCQRRGEFHKCGMGMVSTLCRGRQHGGGRWRAISKGLKVRRAEEGGRGCVVGCGSGGGVF